MTYPKRLGLGSKTPVSGRHKVSTSMHLHYVGIKDTPVPKPDSQETEKILVSQFLLFKRVQVFTPAEQTCEHKMVDSGFSLYP
jgi:hypothetical protein